MKKLRNLILVALGIGVMFLLIRVANHVLDIFDFTFLVFLLLFTFTLMPINTGFVLGYCLPFYIIYSPFALNSLLFWQAGTLHKVCGCKKFASALFVVLLLFFLVLPSRANAGNLERVYLNEVMDLDFKAIITRSNGEMYMIEYGVGVISLWRYEGRFVHVYSRGLFAGVGSKIMLLNKDQEARIWNSEYIGLSQSRTKPSVPPAPNLDVTPTVTINGHPLMMDVLPVVMNGRTLVPMRAIFGALGAYVTWDSSTQTVTATRRDQMISLTIGSDIAYLNGVPIIIDVPAQLIAGRTLVPLRLVSVAFGAQVNWNPHSRTVSINVQ